MSRIEETLRDTLQERVAAPPAVEAVADRAISGATRIRRRRAGAGIAAGLSVVVVGAAVASYLTLPGPAADGPTAAASATWPPGELVRELPVDVLVDRYIFLAGGGLVSLAPVVPESCDEGRCISGVWRVEDGYLAAVFDTEAVVGGSALWRVPEFGQPSVVVDGDGALVVSDGTTQRPGVQVIWADDGRLHIGAYGDGRVTAVRSTPAPEVLVGERDQHGLDPWTVVGDAVVLSDSGSGTQPETWDVWFPDRGDYVPAAYPVITLHGATVDGERIIAWYREDPENPGCLGELDPEEFVPVRSRCPSPFSRDVRIHPSPDGRWWVVLDDREVLVYSAGSFWDGDPPHRQWSGSVTDADGAWLDESAFVTVERSTGTVVTHHVVDGGEDSVTLPIPGPTTNVSVVVDLR